jgi:hypothetical protein
MDPHYGMRFQTGRGLGSLFSGLWRGLKPLAKMGLSAGKKFIKSDFAKNLGSAALDVGKDALKNLSIDVLEGKPISQAGDEQLQLAKQKIASTLKGSGCKRKKQRKQKTMKHAKYNLLA